MARSRFRRRFGRGRRNVRSMFAPARARGGNLSWEACQNLCGDQARVVWPNVGLAYQIECQGDPHDWLTRYNVCIPGNINRGVVTLRRIFLQCWGYETVDQIQANRRHSLPISFSVQLCPVRLDATTGNMLNNDVLSMRNAGDLENSRILYQTVWFPHHDDNSTLTSFQRYGTMPEQTLDIRTMRRWDRQKWALITTLDWESAKFDEDSSQWYIHMRMLFSSYDAI